MEGFKGQLKGSEGQLEGLRASRGGTDERTNERTDGKSPHSTGLCPLPGPLPKKEILYIASAFGYIQSQVYNTEK